MKKPKPPRGPTGDYPVGNCRPPVETRFKPGKSGNPSGRPRKTSTVAEIADMLLREKVAVIENGDKRKIPSKEVILRSTRAKAMKGDLKAADTLFRLAQQASVPNVATLEGETPSLADEAIYQAFLRDLTLGEPASPPLAKAVAAGGQPALKAMNVPVAVMVQKALDDPVGAGARAPAAIASAHPPVAEKHPPSPDSPLDAKTVRDLRIAFGPFTSDK